MQIGCTIVPSRDGSWCASPYGHRRCDRRGPDGLSRHRLVTCGDHDHDCTTGCAHRAVGDDRRWLRGDREHLSGRTVDWRHYGRPGPRRRRLHRREAPSSRAVATPRLAASSSRASHENARRSVDVSSGLAGGSGPYSAVTTHPLKTQQPDLRTAQSAAVNP